MMILGMIIDSFFFMLLPYRFCAKKNVRMADDLLFLMAGQGLSFSTFLQLGNVEFPTYLGMAIYMPQAN